MEVIGVVADTVLSSGKGLRYGVFGGGGVTAMVVEVLLGVGGFDVDTGNDHVQYEHRCPSCFSKFFHIISHK